MTTLRKLFNQYESAECRKYISKAVQIEEGLKSGKNYAELGGCQLSLAKGLIRFKLGNYRLIFKKAREEFIPDSLIQRKHLERFLKRR
ncbi:hypothetical protein ALT761_02251 [Alteromonas sp. 76-1]|jgi:mRNA-degrading endonuclease RelE of RelBE toxin-antitoxin system|uniref:ParE family toxin-like protein n=1 Tax=Alteromonas sp. 76-1 TaxID=2358187 RepID=UPI000FD17DE8|nr:hypothetical protein [Alteromonas sp. 76-1]VEL97250.1 hypothetical protein ALT761_02251 [Alteromonas sp. 76-1]